MFDIDPKAALLAIVGACGSFAAMLQRYINKFDDYPGREAVADFLITIVFGVPVATIAGLYVQGEGYDLASYGIALFAGTMTRDILAAKAGEKVQSIIKIITGGKL